MFFVPEYAKKAPVHAGMKGGAVVKKRKTLEREDVLREMLDFALCPANDALSLAQEETPVCLEGLNLNALTEFKKTGNGGVEMKFVDRLRAMESVLTHLQGGEQDRGEAFLQALGQPVPAPETETVSRR